MPFEFILFLFASVLQWSDLSEARHFRLNQKIRFENVTFSAGTYVDFVEQLPLEVVPVMSIDVKASDCPQPEAQAEMILINPTPDDASRDRSIGVVLKPGCLFELYIELADFYSPSLFARDASPEPGTK